MMRNSVTNVENRRKNRILKHEKRKTRSRTLRVFVVQDLAATAAAVVAAIVATAAAVVVIVAAAAAAEQNDDQDNNPAAATIKTTIHNSFLLWIWDLEAALYRRSIVHSMTSGEMCACRNQKTENRSQNGLVSAFMLLMQAFWGRTMRRS